MATAISSYDLLLAEVASWLNRNDLTAEIPTFIKMLEAKVNRRSRTWQMVQRAYAPITGTGEYTPVPGDYLELKRVRVVGSLVPIAQLPLEYAPINDIDRIQAENNSTQMPRRYCIVGNAIRVAPLPDKSYTLEIVYYAKLPALTSVAQTNWLLSDHPDIYLYGALMSASGYLKNDVRVPMWKAQLAEALGELDVSNEGGERGAEPLRSSFTPYGGRYGTRRGI